MSAERELAEVEGPSNLRLFSEFDRPMALRAIEILSQDKFRGTRYHVPRLELGGWRLAPKPASPLARLREQTELREAHQALLAAGGVAPELVARLVRLDAYLRRFLVVNGVLPHLIVPPEEVRRQEAAQAMPRGFRTACKPACSLGPPSAPGISRAR